MDAYLATMFESFKQELMDIYTTNNDALLYVSNAWRGEASTEYINHLQISGEDILILIRRVEDLQQKINVFVSSLPKPDANTSIL